jgi:beta-phosphoglucomutase
MPLAVIFDMDGVLVDSFQAHLQAWKSMARDEGLPFDPARFTANFGRTSRELIAALWPDRSYTDAQHEDLADRREAAYRRIVQANFPEMPGARELIHSLHRDGFALALGSSGPVENADLVLEKLGVRNLFRAVVTGKDVRRGKPDPEVFLTAAARLGIAPRSCAVIEDAPPGIAAANASGMLSIGLSSPGPAYRPLSDARLVVHSLTDLSPALIRVALDKFASNT